MSLYFPANRKSISTGSNHVKNFTNFSCRHRALLLNNALGFAVGMAVFSSLYFLIFFAAVIFPKWTNWLPLALGIGAALAGGAVTGGGGGFLTAQNFCGGVSP